MNKRDRITRRNQMIHNRFDELQAKKTKAGKPVYTFVYMLEVLAEEFPPLSQGYIQQILAHEPDKFPKPFIKKRTHNAKRRR